MYIGSTGERGLHHLIWEVVDNAVDEAMAGYATQVDVRLLDDGGVEVSDDGRGIPVAMHDSGIPTVDVVMTVLHAGGKFEEAPTRSPAVCTVSASPWSTPCPRGSRPISAVTATNGSRPTTTRCPATSNRVRPPRRPAQRIRFWADPAIFETTNYDFETVARRLQEMAFLNKGLTINLTDERVTPEEVVDEVVSDTAEAPKSAEENAAEQAARRQKVKHRTFHYPGGLVDFVKHINRTKQPIHYQRRRLLRQG